MPSIDEYSRVVTESEFKDSKVWGENADRFFPDTEALIGWIDQPSLVPILPHVSEAHQQDFRAHVIDEMIRETRWDDGRCFETFRRINLLATK